MGVRRRRSLVLENTSQPFSKPGSTCDASLALSAAGAGRTLHTCHDTPQSSLNSLFGTKTIQAVGLTKARGRLSNLGESTGAVSLGQARVCHKRLTYVTKLS